MRVRQLSPTGDFQFGSGQLDYLINTPAAVAQVVQTNLRLILGEWYLDLSLGTPYLQGVIGKHSQDVANATLVAVITSCQGVVNIDNFESTIDPYTRKYSTVSGTINTIYGQTLLDLQNEKNL